MTSTNGRCTVQSGLGDVTSLLWHERGLLERLLATTGANGQARDGSELAATVHELKLTEVARAAEVDALAGQLSLAAGTTLAQLADVAPEPWAWILGDHREALRDLTAELHPTVAQLSLLEFLR